MGVVTKDGKYHGGPVVDTHDGFLRVGDGTSYSETIPKSEVKQIDTPVKDVGELPKR